ncbi:hypothetical protein [Micromonospora sp. NPDC092111]|uniref:hypothetical protein n=1 Tax=Micromonospora sp. NPDC092111 TaxID=3364289 RepID=UPI00382EBED4
MPRYRSLYDPNPLPDPGSGSQDLSSPPDVAPSKSLRVNWSSPQPLHTVTAGGGKGGGNDGTDGGGGSSDGGSADGGGGSSGGGPDPAYRQKLESDGPEWESVHIRPEDLLAHEQSVLDRVKPLADRFNALVTESEAVLGADFWGTEEGVNQIQRSGIAADRQRSDIRGAIENSPHYTYTPSAHSTRKFLEGLRMNQRAALQHAADAITMTGGFIELLNSTADAYASADQYSVFPNKSSIHKGQGD